MRPVRTRRDLSTFIKVPHQVYRDDPAWVPPLHIERRLHLSERHNPYFEHARWQGWVAYRGGRAVGRVSAQIDELVRARHGPDLGQFGFLEAEDDPQVFGALLAAAESWLRERGARRVAGPFNLSINHECGLLVEGFDTPPSFMMGHARPYVATHLARFGYRPVKDLLAYWIEGAFDRPPLMRSLLRRYSERVRTRMLDGSRMADEMETLRGIFNDAWAENWGFVPFTRAEFQALGRDLRLFVDDGLIHIAEVDGEPAAFIACMPNLNEAIRDLRGRLLPFGWAKLVWRLRRRRVRTGRVALMGVLRRYQDTPFGAALALSVIGAIQAPGTALGIREVELSWILEDNTGMRGILDAIGARAYKRYRLYDKALPSAPGTGN